MPSVLDPLPEEGQQLVNLVAETYSWSGIWPVWQYVAQQAFAKHGIEAEATMRSLPQWRWPQWTKAYQAVRTVPAAAGNSAPDVEARTVLTVHGLYHAPKGTAHPWARAFLKALELAAGRQTSVTLSPEKVSPLTLPGDALVSALNGQASTGLSVGSLGLLLSGEPTTTGGGVREADEWSWDLTRYRPLQPWVSPDVKSYLTKFDAVLGSQAPEAYTPVSSEALPRALDHLNVVWKAVAQQRLFFPRGLASAASLVEPVSSGDQLTARLGSLADIFDLFLRTATGGSPAGGSLNAFREQLVHRLPAGLAQDQARTAVAQLADINRIRNGRLHTDAANWAESLYRLGVPTNDSPAQQWQRIRAVAVGAVYTIIELLQPLIP
jgi:hypothetical protein